MAEQYLIGGADAAIRSLRLGAGAARKGRFGEESCSLVVIRSGLRFFTKTIYHVQPAMPRIVSLAANSAPPTPANLRSLTSRHFLRLRV